MNLLECYHAFLTISRKEISRVLRIWAQTILPPLVTYTLYFIVFGNLIGSQIRPISGFSYLEYITPGLAMMSIISNSYMNVCSSFFGNKFQKSVEELMVSPTPNSVIIIGYCFGGVMRGLTTGTLVIAVSSLFTEVHIFHSFSLISFALLTSIFFSLAGLTNALYAKKFDDISIIPTFILTPMTYLGGVFYSIDHLPPFWQKVSQFNPILYMIDGFRYGSLGIHFHDLSYSFGILVLATLALFYMNHFLMKKGVGLRT